MSDEMLDTYRTYLQSQCSYWSLGNDGYLSGEIVSQWFQRKSLQREMTGLQAQLSRMDGVLSGLLYEQKKRLSRLGRNGAWSGWLRQNKIPRATADRLAMEHVEFFGLQDELPKRERPEPLEANVSMAACRVSDRHELMLKSPRSRMMFLTCLADRLGVSVEFGEEGSIRLSTPPPASYDESDCRVPNVMQVADDGSVVPVDYELTDECEVSDAQVSPQETSRPLGMHPAPKVPADSTTEEANQ
jgi:hypothetical protein